MNFALRVCEPSRCAANQIRVLCGTFLQLAKQWRRADNTEAEPHHHDVRGPNAQWFNVLPKGSVGLKEVKSFNSS